MDGAKIDDLTYLKQHSIDARQVSSLLGSMYLKMIFGQGFIHCDPHQGNMLVRHIQTSPLFGLFSRNFEIVLCIYLLI